MSIGTPSVALSTTEALRSQSKCSLDYPVCQANRYLNISMPPICLLLGTLGNAFILLVMLKKPLRQTAFGCYLSAIAINDTIAIWTGLIRHFVKHVTEEGYDLRDISPFACGLQRFLVYGAADTSVWLLLCVTLERTISTVSPGRYMRFKGVKKTLITICVVTILQYGWNIQVFFTTGVPYNRNDVNDFKCGYTTANAEWYWKKVHLYIALVDYSIFPFVAMLIMNIMICVILRKRDKELGDCANLNSKDGKKSSSVSNKTLMLMPVTFFFLVTTLPSIIINAVEQIVETKGNARAIMELMDTITTLLFYLNHSLNFFLYCLTGRMFRQRIATILQSMCCKNADAHDTATWETTYTRSPAASRRHSRTSAAFHSVTPSPYSSINSVKQQEQSEEQQRLFAESESHETTDNQNGLKKKTRFSLTVPLNRHLND